jgi:hypothetical protein
MLIVASVVFASGLASAEEIRIACIIPEAPSLNMPLLSEKSYQLLREVSREAPIALQKESTETRLVEGQLQSCVVQTVYIK